MTEGILLALAAAVSYGFLGISFEAAAKRRYEVWTFIFYKQLIGFGMGLAFALWLGGPLYSTKLAWLGLIGAASYVATLAAYLVASRERDIAANWTILNLSVILPIGVSIAWFGDAFTPLKAVGVVFTLLSIALIGGGGGDLARLWRNSSWLRYILVAFLLNGVLAMLFRFVPEGGGALFTVYFYGISFLMAAPYKWKAAQPADRGMVGLSALGAATHWVGIMCTMAALGAMESITDQAGVIVYPITNGLVIPIGVLLGALILRQRIAPRMRSGVVAGMIGLTLLSLS